MIQSKSITPNPTKKYLRNSTHHVLPPRCQLQNPQVLWRRRCQVPHQEAERTAPCHRSLDHQNHSYGHLPVITVFFYGIIHSINGVSSVLITDKWP